MSRHPTVALLGLPTDEASSFARGAIAGPAEMRQALYSESSNLSTEVGLDLADEPRFVDLGDLEFSDGTATRQTIEAAIVEQLNLGQRVLSVGGDHSVTYPILRAYGRRYPGLTVVHLDAHPDLYDEFQGNRYSHACPFARVMEERLAARLIQIGIRTANEPQRLQAERLGVEIVPRDRWLAIADLDLEPPVYLSLDLDALDPAFAPGVSHLEPGGLSSREVLDIIWALPGPVGADVVELNPSRDAGGVTAYLAAKLVKELAARMLGG